MEYYLVDYYGKFTQIIDKDMYDGNNIISSITHTQALDKDQIEERRYWSNHYGVVAYIGKNKELIKLYNE